MDAGVNGDLHGDLLACTAGQRMVDREARGALKRQCRTRCARRFVVSMMQIDPTPFGVGDRAALVLRKRERGAGQACLPDERQHNCDEPQVAELRSSVRPGDLHRP
jgi:hypothetical protein